jgi:glutamyl-Q tRNA(Asp) synthetase
LCSDHSQAAALPADLVLKRKDGLYAYTLAVVVDDGWQGITDVIRGRDLLEQTPAQCRLLEYLHYPAPGYGHLPVLIGADGHKLSKQAGAAAIDDTRPLDNLRMALRYLGQNSAAAEAGACSELLRAATAAWDRAPLRYRDADAMVYPEAGSP